MNKIRKSIANNIVYYRIEKNWSQEYLAELLGTSTTYLSEIENEKRNISIDYLEHISDIFKINAYELLIEREPLKRRVKRKSSKY